MAPIDKVYIAECNKCGTLCSIPLTIKYKHYTTNRAHLHFEDNWMYLTKIYHRPYVLCDRCNRFEVSKLLFKYNRVYIPKNIDTFPWMINPLTCDFYKPFIFWDCGI